MKKRASCALVVANARIVFCHLTDGSSTRIRRMTHLITVAINVAYAVTHQHFPTGTDCYRINALCMVETKKLRHRKK